MKRSSPMTTLWAVFLGHLPRLVQPRGWAIAVLPMAVVLGGYAAAVLSRVGSAGPGAPQGLYNLGLASVMVPVMALVAAPAGLREDLEQRALSFLLVRPVPVGVLPFARGVGWFLWGGLWLGIASLGLGRLGLEIPQHFLGLLLGYWAELAFLSLLGLLFRRGTLWGVIVLFLWDPLVRFLPGSLQGFTFIHHLRVLAGIPSQGTGGLFSQAPLASHAWASALALLAFGVLCWAVAGWKLRVTPFGLSGGEGEG